DGKTVAAEVRERARLGVEELIASGGPRPGIATVLVGDDPGSKIYVRNKGEAAKAAGMQSFHHDLPADTPQEDLADLIGILNDDDDVHGILLQLPVPPQIDADEMVSLIDPAKDVDGLTPVSAGLLALGRADMVPCTPRTPSWSAARSSSASRWPRCSSRPTRPSRSVTRARATSRRYAVAPTYSSLLSACPSS